MEFGRHIPFAKSLFDTLVKRQILYDAFWWIYGKNNFIERAMRTPFLMRVGDGIGNKLWRVAKRASSDKGQNQYRIVILYSTKIESYIKERMSHLNGMNYYFYDSSTMTHR